MWAFLGWRSSSARVSYRVQPDFRLEPKNSADVIFNAQEIELPYPVSVEVYTKKILYRSEFRALCDKYQTQAAILEAIQRL